MEWIYREFSCGNEIIWYRIPCCIFKIETPQGIIDKSTFIDRKTLFEMFMNVGWEMCGCYHSYRDEEPTYCFKIPKNVYDNIIKGDV